MSLTEFIQQNNGKILSEWIKFAGTILPEASEKDLRDHAVELLDAVVIDMESSQSKNEQSEKSQGNAAGGALGLVGHLHAAQRLHSGFNLDQLVSEYRALRASVLRLWVESPGEKDISEMTRFNEAIDESLTEATLKFSEMLSKTQEHFVAVLGHDLRTPIAVIINGATLLSESGDEEDAKITSRILKSAWRMERMIRDLLDLARTRLGSGIPIVPVPMDLASVCSQTVSDLESAHPKSRLKFQSKGDLRGEWDHDRITQVVCNLISNAIQYGNGAVDVSVEGHDTEAVLIVHNEESFIPEKKLKTIFEPMVRQHSNVNPEGLGLGLYIAHEIVTAHGGTVVVTSDEKDGTTFTVRLPRHASE